MADSSDFLPIELDHKPTHSLPYARTLGSAKITPANIEEWKNTVAPEFKHYFTEKYELLVKAQQELIEEYYYNKLVYESQIGFKPTIGEEYYLYERHGETFLSLVGPKHAWWGGYIGTFTLTPQFAWRKIHDETN